MVLTLGHLESYVGSGAVSGHIDPGNLLKIALRSRGDKLDKYRIIQCLGLHEVIWKLSVLSRTVSMESGYRQARRTCQHFSTCVATSRQLSKSMFLHSTSRKQHAPHVATMRDSPLAILSCCKMMDERSTQRRSGVAIILAASFLNIRESTS